MWTFPRRDRMVKRKGTDMVETKTNAPETIAAREITEVTVRHDGNLYAAEWHSQELRVGTLGARYAWHDVTVTDDAWQGPRCVSVREDGMVPRCECGNVFTLCHPDA